MTTLDAVRQPRAAHIPPNCLHGVFRAVEDWERRTGRAAIKLHVGEPAFSPPPAAVEALAEAARAGRAGYTSCEGTGEMRAALSTRLADRYGLESTPDDVFICPGSCQGLAALMQALAGEGDEILMPQLHWPIHLQQALLAGLVPRFYPLRADLSPELEAFPEVATTRTRIVLINSPANPTGAVLGRSDLARLVSLAQERDWFVISDEAYEDFAFDGEHVAAATLEQGLPPSDRRVCSTYTFSKAYAMTGYRLGFVVTPNQQVAKQLRTVQEASIIAPATPVQEAGLAALADPDAAARNHAFVRHNRDLAVERLRQGGALAAWPSGGWYAMLDVGAHGWSGEDFAVRLLESRGVAVAPANGCALRPRFDSHGVPVAMDTDPAADGLIRLAFCGESADVATGVELLADFLADGR